MTREQARKSRRELAAKRAQSEGVPTPPTCHLFFSCLPGRLPLAQVLLSLEDGPLHVIPLILFSTDFVIAGSGSEEDESSSEPAGGIKPGADPEGCKCTIL